MARKEETGKKKGKEERKKGRKDFMKKNRTK